MEPILSELTRILDKSINETDRFNGDDFVEFHNGGVQANQLIYENFIDLSKILDSSSIKFKIIMEKLFDWNLLLKEKVDKFENDEEMEELKKFLSDEAKVINLTDEEKEVISRRISIKRSDYQKDVYNLIEKNLVFHELLKDALMKIDEDSKQTQNAMNIIDDIKQRYHEAGRAQKKREIMRNMKMEKEIENSLPEKATTENHLEITQHEKSIQIVENFSMKFDSENDFSNTENWNRFRYSLRGGYFPETELIYMIQALNDTLEQCEDVSVTLVKLEDISDGLGYHYDILSNIIRIEPAGLEVLFNPKVPWRISIPYSIIRSSNREVVIFCKDETQQRYFELDTQDILYEESREEGIKFAEASLPSPNCLCIVVSKRKVEKFEINKKGMTIESKVDDRISLAIPPSSIMIPIPMQFVVQSIESGLINEIKMKLKTPILNGIQSISPIIEISSELERKLLKPITLQLPIPFPTGYLPNKNRIFSAAPPPAEKNDRRPKTALTRQISNESNSIIKLALYSEYDQVWRVQRDHKPNLNKNGDSMSIELQKLEKQKLVAVRCTEEVSDEKIQKALEIIEESSECRIIQFICAQKIENANRLILLIAPPNKVDKMQKFLLEQNYNEETMSVSSELNVRERDKFLINFRGNIEPVTRSELIVTYNSQLTNRLEFYVQEKDKFAQKNKDSYQGYVSVIKAGETFLDKLWEIVIFIPKFENERNNSLHKDFDFKPTDTINKEYLHYLSHEIGEDWKHLGYALRVPDEAIRRIANDTRREISSMTYQCLLKWIKNLPVYSNKVELMEKALKYIGRNDLVKDLIFRSMEN